MALQFADFISSPFISLFSPVALPFAIFAIPGLFIASSLSSSFSVVVFHSFPLIALWFFVGMAL
ncbi:hypothetical protein HID58_076450, partial [Brassica napus]